MIFHFEGISKSPKVHLPEKSPWTQGCFEAFGKPCVRCLAKLLPETRILVEYYLFSNPAASAVQTTTPFLVKSHNRIETSGNPRGPNCHEDLHRGWLQLSSVIPSFEAYHRQLRSPSAYRGAGGFKVGDRLPTLPSETSSRCHAFGRPACSGQSIAQSVHQASREVHRALEYRIFKRVRKIHLSAAPAAYQT